MSVSSAPAVVAPLKRGATGCSVCAEPLEVVQQINAAIWTPERERRRNYRTAALAVYAKQGKCDDDLCIRTLDDGEHDRHLDPKTVTRHAEHVEVSWRVATAERLPSGREKPVFPIDYDSVTDAAAEVGVRAMQYLSARIELGEVEDRDLVAAAKLGVGAVATRAKIESAQRNPQIGVLALMGVVSGHLEAPPGEVVDVTPLDELMSGLQAERAELEALAQGE
jgi:hypothetical protein